MIIFNINGILFIIVCLTVINATLSKSDLRQSKTEKYKCKQGRQASHVLSRNLVSAEPLAKDILIEHGTYYEKTDERRFKSNVLGYVTPWNSNGYDIAKIFNKKFTHISPVWLQISRKGDLLYEVKGTHDIDFNWMNELKNNNSKIKITPRVLFDNNWTIEDLSSLFRKQEEQIELSNALVKVCRSAKFSGVVLEVWAQIRRSISSDILIHFIQSVAKVFKNKSLELILVVPPVRNSGNELFGLKHFDKLSDFVSLFSLMTYDYSSPQRPGPNSPINWMKHCVEALVPNPSDQKRSKILLGLNFYGNDYTVAGGGPIIGHEFIKLIKNFKGRLTVDNDSMENFFEVRSANEKHLVFYPTLYSVFKRIELAQELGTGISIWELGQGLNYFYDLL